MAITQNEYEKRVFQKQGSKYKLIGKYVKWNLPVEIQCNNCGYSFFKRPNTLFYTNVLCPKCDKSSSRCIKNVNDLWTTRPDVARLLKNPENGYKYKQFSEKVLEFICPDCGNLISKSIHSVSTRGLSCDYCSDGISYPNRFMGNLLKELGVDFETEFKIEPYSYRYDFKFILNDKKYLIEMDGFYGHGCINTTTRTKEHQLYDDKQKSIIAKDNGYILIRIDCKYTNINYNDRMNYIIKSIQKSELNILFDLNNIDYKKINENSLVSIIKLISQAWNNGIRSYDELCEMFKIKHDGIRRYLKMGCELKLINQNYNDLLKTIRLASNKKLQKSKGCQVICNETNQCFVSIAEAQRLTGAKNISRCLKGIDKHSGKLPDGTKLTWRIA